MSTFRPRGTAVALNGEERHFLFTLNMIDQIEEKYDKPLKNVIEDVTNDVDSGHLLRDLVVMLLNDEAGRNERMQEGVKYPIVSAEEVGDMIGLDNYYEVLTAILRAYGISLPEPDEDKDPNQKSGQTKN